MNLVANFQAMAKHVSGVNLSKTTCLPAPSSLRRCPPPLCAASHAHSSAPPAVWFCPPVLGDPKHNIQQFKSHYVRWRFDPNATDMYVEPLAVLVDLEGETPRVDDRFAGRA